MTSLAPTSQYKSGERKLPGERNPSNGLNGHRKRTLLIPCPGKTINYCSLPSQTPVFTSLLVDTIPLADQCSSPYLCRCPEGVFRGLRRKRTRVTSHPNPGCILTNNCNFTCENDFRCGHLVVITYYCSGPLDPGPPAKASPLSGKEVLQEQQQMELGTDIYILIFFFAVFTILVIAIVIALIYFHRRRHALVLGFEPTPDEFVS